MKTIEEINALVKLEADQLEADKKMMIENGWAVNPKAKTFLAFIKGDFHVWEIYGGWQFAELKYGAYFTGHTKFKDLQSVVKHSIA